MKKKTARDYMSKENKKLAKNMDIRFFNEKDHYSKVRYAKIYKGYDFLEDFSTIKTYIIRKHKINGRLFPVLLKLMGMRIFSMADMAALPKNFKYNKIDNLLGTGLINVLMDHKQVYKRLYCLNQKGRNIVIEFYQCLSGEKKMPLNRFNPLYNKKTQIPYDLKKLEVMKKLRDMPVKEHNKTLFSD